MLLTSKLNEHLTVGLADEHSCDSDSRSGAIISHDHIRDIFNTGINYDEKTGASALRIAHLVDKSALTALSYDDLRREGLLVLRGDVLLNLLKLGRVTLFAHLRVVFIVVDSTDLRQKWLRNELL